MVISSNRYTNKKDEDDLLVVFLKDNNGEELERYSFYLNKNNSKLDKELRNSIQHLPKLLETIYNKGLAGENIEFSYDVVTMD